MALNYGSRFGGDASSEGKRSRKHRYRVTGGRRKGAGVVSRELVRQNIKARMDDIPTLPTAVLEVLKLLSNPRANARHFEKALSKDQVLTARLIKLANSTFYGTSRRITAVKEVILRLGLLSVRSLVLAASTSRILNRPMPGYGYKEGGMWEHSLATAMAARRVARIANLDNVYAEEAFLAGLLHDIGKVVLAKEVFQQSARFHALAHAKGVLAAEEELFGVSHVVSGMQIAERWRFSKELGEAIHGHHDPNVVVRSPTEDETTRMKAASTSTILHLGMREDKEEAAADKGERREEQVVPPLVDLAHIANAMVQALGLGLTDDAPPPENIRPDSLARLNITEDHLQAIVDDLTEEFSQMSVMFSVATGGDLTGS